MLFVYCKSGAFVSSHLIHNNKVVAYFLVTKFAKIVGKNVHDTMKKLNHKQWRN